MNIDMLVSQNSEGKLDDKTRWNLKKTIEESSNSEYPCILCETQQPVMPSKRIIGSEYCKQHLLYAIAIGKDIKYFI
ncbi:MAG: hypothetical protein KatS3mg002_1187 [Candidatus Woesearchaeota archaeon]|nr:MAG: hypothetical protein KatS3mg002_1187 [Candidatus Woesearchaeota archaeon]